ncbi:hypothetical protein B0O80DRAFT_457706 [Mortierella sp. GBAus27b]|nr:hypothetical protein B0O80DRAFT_457706 [Mortierella sp. GBAus27b]
MYTGCNRWSVGVLPCTSWSVALYYILCVALYYILGVALYYILGVALYYILGAALYNFLECCPAPT